MHHTDCAMGRFSQGELAQRIMTATNHPFHDQLEVFSDDVAAIIEDVGRIRAYASLVHREDVRGFLYELATDALKEVIRQ